MQALRVLEQLNQDVGLSRPNGRGRGRRARPVEEAPPGGSPVNQDMLRARAMVLNYRNLLENWQCARDNAVGLNVSPPELLPVMDEARKLHEDGLRTGRSYIHHYLNDDGRGARTETWTRADCLFAVLTACYLLPNDLVGQVVERLRQARRPSARGGRVALPRRFVVAPL
jgi:hypothetical protein